MARILVPARRDPAVLRDGGVTQRIRPLFTLSTTTGNGTHQHKSPAVRRPADGQCDGMVFEDEFGLELEAIALGPVFKRSVAEWI